MWLIALSAIARLYFGLLARPRGMHIMCLGPCGNGRLPWIFGPCASPTNGSAQLWVASGRVSVETILFLVSDTMNNQRSFHDEWEDWQSRRRTTVGVVLEPKMATRASDLAHRKILQKTQSLAWPHATMRSGA